MTRSENNQRSSVPYKRRIRPTMQFEPWLTATWAWFLDQDEIDRK